MYRPDRTSSWPAAMVAASLLAVAALGVAAEAQPYRYGAPIEIVKPAPFVELALPPAAYAYALQPDLRDLRLIDAAGERVPFAMLAPPAFSSGSERLREATLFPLPQRPAAGAVWPSPVEVTVEGDRITVRRSAATTASAAAAPRESPGWLIDLGELAAGEPAPRRLQLRWSGPTEFSAAYAIETSPDLRSWSAGPGGQVMALQSTSGVLAQPVVGLGDASGRFVRLTWLDPATSPLLTGAASVAAAPGLVAVDATHELVFAAGAVPAAGAGKEPEPRGSLHFDLGGVLPLVDLDLRFASGTRVVPVRLQGRSRVDEPWRELGSGVFYRIERDGQATEAPALALTTPARFLRLVPDERAAALDPAQTRLVVHARLASLVFATSGQAPFRLLAGSPDAIAGALPATTLVPQLDEERKRFGQARLGAFTEAPEVAVAVERAAREARFRPWLLWGVLGFGVLGLALLVWRLANSSARSAPPAG